MLIQAPCRLGERFHCEKPFLPSAAVLTALDFFYWTNGGRGTTLCGKRNPDNEQEHTAFFYPKDAAEGVRIEFELPDEMFQPGYPLRKLGIDTNAVGRVQSIALCQSGTERRWEYAIYYGKEYGGPRKTVHSDVLDELFAPVLPARAVNINLKDYL